MKKISLDITEAEMDVINYVFGTYVQNTKGIKIGSPDFIKYNPGVDPVWSRISDATHEAGWCKDPDCPKEDANRSW